MKRTTLSALFLVSMTVAGYSQALKVLTFRSGPVIPISDSLSEDIFDYKAFKAQYGEKSRAADIYYVSWAPDRHCIAVVVGDVYTGGYDDIWVYSMKEEEIKCITAVFPHSPVRTFGIPIWLNADTLEFSTQNQIIGFDVSRNEIISKTRSASRPDPSYVSPDGEFHYEYGSPGYPLYIYDRDGKQKAIIDQRKLRGGSLLGEAFSSDSRYLAIEQFMGHGESRILLMDLRSFSMNALKVPFDLMFSILGQSNWHPNRPILHVADRDGTLHFLNITTHTERVLALKDYYIRGAAWSPDGKQLALILGYKRAQRHSVRIIRNPFSD
jgi:WD40 repeat protein